MPLLNISEMINDPDFCQSFTIYRNAGTWTNGRFTSSTTVLNFSGVIVPMNTKDMAMLPDGDTISGAINIYTLKPLYTSHLNQTTGTSGGTSDELVYQGERYKIIQIRDLSDYGYYKAAATKKLGA